MHGLPCDTRSSIIEGDKKDSFLFKSDNLLVKVPLGFSQGWSAFHFFMTPQSYERHDELTRKGISCALVQPPEALLFTHFPQSKEIPRIIADDVRVVLRKCNVFMDVCQHVLLWNKFDVWAIADENCNFSQLAAAVWDLHHIAPTEVATNKQIFANKAIVSPPMVSFAPWRECGMPVWGSENLIVGQRWHNAFYL